MAGREHRRDARRTQHGVPILVLVEDCNSGAVPGVCDNSRHRSALVSANDLRHARKIAAGRVVESNRKFVVTHPVDGSNQMIDRVIRNRPGAVTTRISYLKHEILGNFLGCQYSECDSVTLRIKVTINTLRQSKFRINRVTGIRGQPAGTVECAVGLPLRR